MTTPLPEPVMAKQYPDGTVRNFYTIDQLRAYSAAEYRRGIEAAAQVCTGIAIAPSNVVLGVAVECATAIRKLGEAK